MAKIITLTGAMGSGKDTILKEVLKDQYNINPIISVTTRPIRLGETHGVEYIFISEPQMRDYMHNDKLVEYRTYNTKKGVWQYGILKSSIDLDSDKVYIVIVDINGLRDIRAFTEAHKSSKVVSFFIDCPAQTRMFRALNREGNMDDVSVDEVCRRNLDDAVKVIPYKYICDYILMNKTTFDLDKCVDIIKSTI